MAVVEQIFPALTWRIRQLAMYPEKEITEVELPEDWDGMHFGLYHQYELTGVVSLFIDGNTAQFRKMAVLPTDQVAVAQPLLLLALFMLVFECCFIDFTQGNSFLLVLLVL